MPWLVESPSSPIWQGVSSEHEQIILGSFVQLVSVGCCDLNFNLEKNGLALLPVATSFFTYAPTDRDKTSVRRVKSIQ